jgi:hypothetical protein
MDPETPGRSITEVLESLRRLTALIDDLAAGARKSGPDAPGAFAAVEPEAVSHGPRFTWPQAAAAKLQWAVQDAAASFEARLIGMAAGVYDVRFSSEGHVLARPVPRDWIDGIAIGQPVAAELRGLLAEVGRRLAGTAERHVSV